MVNETPATGASPFDRPIDRQSVPTTEHPSQHSSTLLLPKERNEKGYAKSSSSWLRTWRWELVASLFAIACLAANLAILLTIDGKPLRSWKVAHVSITPNTLISIFSTLAKSSMLLPVTEGIGQLKWIFFHRRAHKLSLVQTFDNARAFSIPSELQKLRSNAYYRRPAQQCYRICAQGNSAKADRLFQSLLRTGRHSDETLATC